LQAVPTSPLEGISATLGSPFPFAAHFLNSSPFKGEAGRGMELQLLNYPHPHPFPPLEGEGIFKLALRPLEGEGVGGGSETETPLFLEGAFSRKQIQFQVSTSIEQFRDD